jgi:hypothetical protein
MIKFDICGQTVMLYEVAYIAVPSLAEEAKIKDKEIAIEEEEEEDGGVKVEEIQCEI